MARSTCLSDHFPLCSTIKAVVFSCVRRRSTANFKIDVVITDDGSVLNPTSGSLAALVQGRELGREQCDHRPGQLLRRADLSSQPHPHPGTGTEWF